MTVVYLLSKTTQLKEYYEDIIASDNDYIEGFILGGVDMIILEKVNSK